MARINLITRHFNDNNGTVLQVYATCRILEKLGHTVTVVNLQDRNLVKEFTHLATLRRFIQILKFHLFRKRYFSNLTSRIRSLEGVELPDADYFVVGSDQVWNKSVAKSLFKDYFLNSIPKDCIKLSLSSSFGVSEWEEGEELTSIVKQSLSEFRAISVREDSGVLICQNVFNLPAVQLIDPTLAWSDFSHFIKGCRQKKEISFFSFNPLGYITDIVDFIAKRESLSIRNLTSNGNNKYKSGYKWQQGPEQWLRYIAQSSVFVSDSFHGVVFSILFNKQFVAVRANKEKFGRIQSLLEMLQLESQIALSYDRFVMNYDSFISPINYTQVNKIIKIKQKDFFLFINTNIE